MGSDLVEAQLPGHGNEAGGGQPGAQPAGVVAAAAEDEVVDAEDHRKIESGR